jgi:hypothetical protein
VPPLRAHCYSDIYALFNARGLADGNIPCIDRPVEYPVLIGAAMQAASWAAHSVGGAIGRGREAFINWDLMAMALTAAAMAAWASRHGILAGVLFGLAIATKFYPLFLLAALIPLCLRAGRLRACWVTTAAATATWLAVNLPVAIVAFDNWSTFYWMNTARSFDWGSIWYVTGINGWPLTPARLAVPRAMLLLWPVWCGLAVAAARRPWVGQLYLAVPVPVAVSIGYLFATGNWAG